MFDDATGRLVELDLRGSFDEVLARLAPAPASVPRGRPKLGVTAREITLLPSHWEWLAAQPGGASAALRRLDARFFYSKSESGGVRAVFSAPTGALA